MTGSIITTKVIVSASLLGLIFLTAASLWLFPTRLIEEYTFASVEQRDLVQTVNEVGSVKSFKEVELNFVQAGTLAERLVAVGEEVSEGQVLLKLDDTALKIQQAEAIANVEAARSNLNKIVAGETSAGIAVAQAEVNQAASDYQSALNNLDKVEKSVQENIAQAEKELSDLQSSGSGDVTTFEQAVSSAEINLANTKKSYQTSIDNKRETLMTTISSKLSVANTSLDEIDSLLTNDDIADQLSSKNTSYLYNTKAKYTEAKSLLSATKLSFDLAKTSLNDQDIAKASLDTSLVLTTVADALDLCFATLEHSTIVKASLDTYKANINSEITLINTAISALETARQGLADAKSAFETNVSTADENLKKAKVALENAIVSARNTLNSAKIDGDQKISTAQGSLNSAQELWELVKRRLDKLKTPARPEDIALYQAKLKQAQSALDLINQKIADSIIKSPIDGKVVKIEYEAGEQVNQSGPAISVLAQNNFEIEVDISESDIAKLNQGDVVEITLDAFGQDNIFAGKVEFIEPAETIIQDVIYYKVIIRFTEKEQRLEEVKPGMTANVMITTNRKENALVVPARAIIEKDGRKIVRVMKGKTIEEVEVKTGLRGDGGQVEVSGDIKKGDLVVTFTKDVEKRIFRYSNI